MTFQSPPTASMVRLPAASVISAPPPSMMISAGTTSLTPLRRAGLALEAGVPADMRNLVTGRALAVFDGRLANGTVRAD